MQYARDNPRRTRPQYPNGTAYHERMFGYDWEDQEIDPTSLR